mmetsp:Transcript_5694/g.16086  ORF Transcript_5694/g.16086 Transcript_5694/m.16086 type:complete len:204 (+) Transcript_5694:557-1168(+)
MKVNSLRAETPGDSSPSGSRRETNLRRSWKMPIAWASKAMILAEGKSWASMIRGHNTSQSPRGGDGRACGGPAGDTDSCATPLSLTLTSASACGWYSGLDSNIAALSAGSKASSRTRARIPCRMSRNGGGPAAGDFASSPEGFSASSLGPCGCPASVSGPSAVGAVAVVPSSAVGATLCLLAADRLPSHRPNSFVWASFGAGE